MGKGAVEVEPARFGHRGEHVPDESRTVDPESAHAVEIVVDVGGGDAARLRKEEGLVGGAGVHPGFHLVHHEPVPRGGPAPRLQVEHDDLFPAVRERRRVGGEVRRCDQGVDLVPDAQRVSLAPPGHREVPAGELGAFVVLRKRQVQRDDFSLNDIGAEAIAVGFLDDSLDPVSPIGGGLRKRLEEVGIRSPGQGEPGIQAGLGGGRGRGEETGTNQEHGDPAGPAMTFHMVNIPQTAPAALHAARRRGTATPWRR